MAFRRQPITDIINKHPEQQTISFQENTIPDGFMFDEYKPIDPKIQACMMQLVTDRYIDE